MKYDTASSNNDEINNITTVTSQQKGQFKRWMFWYDLKSTLDELLSSNQLSEELVEKSVTQLVSMLLELQNVLPGPKNPNTKYYEMRKKKHFQNTDRNYSQGRNPER